jgi:hypothetical protein
MSFWYDDIADLSTGSSALRRRAHGVIEVVDERFVRVRLRPFARRVTWLESFTWGRWEHRRPGNWCRLSYSEARGCPGFLALQYIVSGRDTTIATARGALVVLDEIARVRGADAIVCDVANVRISHRLLTRWGWQSHCQQRWHRNYIKRFYGDYPPPDPLLAQLGLAQSADSQSAEICMT